MKIFECFFSWKYLLLKTLGKGSFAKVMLVESKVSNDISAVKIIDEERTKPENVDSEVKIASMVAHPHIVRTHRVCRTPLMSGRPRQTYMFMEYVENGTLSDHIINEGPLSESRSRKLFGQLVQAVRYLHEDLSVVHRDIKCENILLDKDYNVKLTDFGLSKIVKETLPVCDRFYGSPAYVAPEVLDGGTYDPFKSDVWSLGIVLFCMLNRDFPDRSCFNKTLYRADISKLLVSADCKDLLARMLSVEPEKRPKAREILDHPWIKKRGA